MLLLAGWGVLLVLLQVTQCYELTPLIPFWTNDWDCQLITIRLLRLIGLPYLSPAALRPGIVYCLTPCYCLAPCIVSPRATASPCAIALPCVLSRPVDWLALCHCLALCYCLAPTTLDTIKNLYLRFEKP